MAKKKKIKWLIPAIIIAAVIILIAATSQCTIEEKAISNFTGTGDEDSSGGGGGGGGGNGATDDECDDDETCIDCDAVFKGIVPLGRTGLRMMAIGHWECEDICPDPNDNCVLNPTDEIPIRKYTDPDNPPDCKCLPKKPGDCNWYDANYGEGTDNLQCGGSCPANQICTSWFDKPNNVAHCECLPFEETDDCGFHVEGDITSFVAERVERPPYTPEELQKLCYGRCLDKDEKCVFWLDQEMHPHCECKEAAQDDDDDQNGDQNGEDDEEIYCRDISISSDGSDWWKCLYGTCYDAQEECMYDQVNNNCFCQDKDDCGWHFDLDELPEIIKELAGLSPEERVKWIRDRIDHFCYGDCDSVEDVCKFYEYEGYLMCECIEDYGDIDFGDFPVTGDQCITTRDNLGVCVTR